KDHVAANLRFITKNGLYDWGSLWADLGIEMPPAERLEEIDALATMVDENRLKYSLDSLCAWRGFPGKDQAPLLEGCGAVGLIPARKRYSTARIRAKPTCSRSAYFQWCTKCAGAESVSISPPPSRHATYSCADAMPCSPKFLKDSTPALAWMKSTGANG